MFVYKSCILVSIISDIICIYIYIFYMYTNGNFIIVRLSTGLGGGWNIWKDVTHGRTSSTERNRAQLSLANFEQDWTRSLEKLCICICWQGYCLLICWARCLWEPYPTICFLNTLTKRDQNVVHFAGLHVTFCMYLFISRLMILMNESQQPMTGTEIW